MKRRIADFIWKFIMKNHTHIFDVVTPDYNTYQCRICKQRNDYFFVKNYQQKYLKK
jgi:hypothetical protein